MHPSQNDNKIEITTTLFVTILLFASIAHITADIYVPSMPIIVKVLHTDSTAVQLTLSIYMLGYSLSHLFYGPVSDRIGRRNPMLFGIGLSLIGSIICFLAPTINLLIFGRFIQGIGIGSTSSVGRSLLRDITSGSQLAKLGSHMGMIITFVTASSPTLGGYMQQYFGWRATFVFLAIYTLCVWLMTWKNLPETNFDLNPNATKMKVVIKNYLILLKSKTFLGYTFCTCFAYSGIIAYLTAAPFLLQNIVGLTPVQFGWLAFLIAGSIFISAFLNSRLVVTQGIEKMLLVGNLLMITAGLLMLLFALLLFLNTWVIMLPIAIFVMGAGFTFSNAFAGAFHPFPKMAGSVGALYGCLQILGAAIASAFMASLHESNQIPLALVLIACGVLSLISLKWLAESTSTA